MLNAILDAALACPNIWQIGTEQFVVGLGIELIVATLVYKVGTGDWWFYHKRQPFEMQISKDGWRIGGNGSVVDAASALLDMMFGLDKKGRQQGGFQKTIEQEIKKRR